jgi:hypothetical protein
MNPNVPFHQLADGGGPSFMSAVATIDGAPGQDDTTRIGHSEVWRSLLQVPLPWSNF